MKKLGLLAVVAMLAVSCNTKPGGNRGVLPVEHEAYTADDLHHEGGHEEGHAEHTEAKHEEETKVDSTAVKVEEVKTDSVK